MDSKGKESTGVWSTDPEPVSGGVERVWREWRELAAKLGAEPVPLLYLTIDSGDGRSVERAYEGYAPLSRGGHSQIELAHPSLVEELFEINAMELELGVVVGETQTGQLLRVSPNESAERALRVVTAPLRRVVNAYLISADHDAWGRTLPDSTPASAPVLLQYNDQPGTRGIPTGIPPRLILTTLIDHLLTLATQHSSRGSLSEAVSYLMLADAKLRDYGKAQDAAQREFEEGEEVSERYLSIYHQVRDHPERIQVSVSLEQAERQMDLMRTKMAERGWNDQDHLQFRIAGPAESGNYGTSVTISTRLDEETADRLRADYFEVAQEVAQIIAKEAGVKVGSTAFVSPGEGDSMERLKRVLRGEDVNGDNGVLITKGAASADSSTPQPNDSDSAE